MPLSQNADFDALLARAATFVEQRLIPLESRLLGSPWSEVEATLAPLRAEVKAMGLWAPQIPRAWGGAGLTLQQFALLGAVLGRSPFGHYCFNCQAPDAGNMEILIEYGTPEQQERYLRPLVEGRIRSCFAMTEPEFAGSNPTYLGTTAVREGDEWVIDGHKWFTSGADGAAFAIVMAVTEPDEVNPYQRASQLIVPLDAPGFRLVRNLPVMGETGGGWMSHAEVRFEGCRVPADHLLGSRGAGFAIAQSRLGPGRIHHCMRWIGICERALDMMGRYALQRTLAPGKPLASQQVIQHWLAECKAEVWAARLMVLDTARRMDEAGQYAVRTEISMIKFFCAGVLQRVLDRALQVHGGLGMLDDLVLAWWYRHERAARIYDGPDEVHKSRVARQMLKALDASASAADDRP